MSKKNILLAITNGFWFIQSDFVYANMNLVHKVLNGEQVFTSNDIAENAEDLRLGCFSQTIDGAVSFGSKYNPFENAQPNSTAVIGISGPIMKYDNCGDPGTKSYANILSKAKSNPNITSVVLVIDSPGGTVDGTQELASIIREFSKPIVAYVDGLMASAAYWIGSGAKEIIANNQTAMIGSIGTMISFMDLKGAYEKLGAVEHTILADASVDKNKDFYEARKGNYDLMKAKLNTINDVFLTGVKENRGSKLDLKKANVLTGKTYLAEEAVENGLIDAINTFDYAVSRAQALARGENSAPINEDFSSQTQTINMKKITLLASQVALIAFCGAIIAPEANSVDVELTDELIEKMNSELASAEKAKADLISVKEKLTASESSVNDLTAKLSTAEAKISTLEHSGSTTPVKTGNDVVETTAEETDFSTPADAELAAKRKALYGE